MQPPPPKAAKPLPRSFAKRALATPGVVEGDVAVLTEAELNTLISMLRDTTTLRRITLTSGATLSPAALQNKLQRIGLRRPVVRSPVVGRRLARALAWNLRHSGCLRELDLMGVTLDREACRMFAKGLARTKTLHRFSLQDCCVGDHGFEELAPVLAKVPSLLELRLVGGTLTDSSTDLLVSVLKTHSARRRDHVWAQSLRGDAMVDPDKAPPLPGLTSIDLSKNQLGNRAAQGLASSLKYDSYVLTVNLRGNDIGEEGARALAKELPDNTVLTSLDLHENDGVEETTLQAIERALQLNRDRPVVPEAPKPPKPVAASRIKPKRSSCVYQSPPKTTRTPRRSMNRALGDSVSCPEVMVAVSPPEPLTIDRLKAQLLQEVKQRFEAESRVFGQCMVPVRVSKVEEEIAVATSLESCVVSFAKFLEHIERMATITTSSPQVLLDPMLQSMQECADAVACAVDALTTPRNS